MIGFVNLLKQIRQDRMSSKIFIFFSFYIQISNNTNKLSSLIKINIKINSMGLSDKFVSLYDRFHKLLYKTIYPSIPIHEVTSNKIPKVQYVEQMEWINSTSFPNIFITG